MQPLIIGIGLFLLGSGALLSGVGHYDGLLGADNPSMLLTADSIQDVKARLVVLGDHAEADEQFRLYQTEMLLPPTMAAPLHQGRWIPVQVRGTEAEAYLRVHDAIPAPGTILVFEGDVEAYWPMYDAGTEIRASKPVLFLEPDTYHEPILFRA